MEGSDYINASFIDVLKSNELSRIRHVVGGLCLGISSAMRFHCHSGTHPRDSARLLAHAVGEQLKHSRDAHQTGGKGPGL